MKSIVQKIYDFLKPMNLNKLRIPILFFSIVSLLQVSCAPVKEYQKMYLNDAEINTP